MKTLLITIFLIIFTTLLFIFLADVNDPVLANTDAQIDDGIVGKQANIFSRPFQKNMTCSDSDYVYQDLKERVNTDKVWWGLDHDSKLIELFLNQTTGRWLVMISFPDKITCGLVGGEMSVPYDKNPYFK